MTSTSGSAATFGLSRRTLLLAGAAGLLAPAALGATTSSAATLPGVVRWTAPRSMNGWPVLRAGARGLMPVPVEGSGAVVTLRSGAAATVLVHVLRRFSYEVAGLGAADAAGHRDDARVALAQESNHLSGTAVAVLPGLLPVGATGNLSAGQVAAVRDILAECDGVVRWGADAAQPAEGSFSIDVAPGDARLARLAARLDGSRANSPGIGGSGAGVAVDLDGPARRRSALALAARQAAG